MTQEERGWEGSEDFRGEIVVVSRIVDYLSSGLYHSPAACLKELVNNSYDADATLVRVFVQPDANRIIIADDGQGMNREEFESNFRRIAETHKRDKSDTTPMGRPKIGKIGIGFIAANEICDTMEIESTKKGSRTKIIARINFAKMRLSLEQRRRNSEDIAKGDYEGTVVEAGENEHYTRVFLRDVRKNAREIFAGSKAPSGYTGEGFGLYGKNADEVCEALRDLKLESWDDLDPYSNTMLEVALNVPVQYHGDWIPQSVSREVNEFVRRVRSLNFTVEYDGTDLRKPTVLWPDSGRTCFVRKFSHQGDEVSAHGYFYVQHGTIKPRDLGGVLLRIRNSAVGGYDSSFMGFPTSRGPLFQRWISAEVWASDELEDALNIDRRTLRVSHPAYIELQRAVHDLLASVLSEARGKLYRKGSDARRKERATTQLDAIREVTESWKPQLGAKTSKKIVVIWQEAQRSKGGEKGLIAKYSVAELYDLVLEVAEEVLSPRDAQRFVEALTLRLASGD